MGRPNRLEALSREELASDGIVGSLVRPWVTAAEFRESLRAGKIVGTGRPAPHSPEYVARVIVRAMWGGKAEVVIPCGLTYDSLRPTRIASSSCLTSCVVTGRGVFSSLARDRIPVQSVQRTTRPSVRSN